MSELLFKVLGEDGESLHGGSGSWFLPKGDEPGAWMPKVSQVEPCVRGYHLARRGDLVSWLGPVIWLAEGRGERVEAEDKVVFSEVRLLRRTAWDEREWQTGRLMEMLGL